MEARLSEVQKRLVWLCLASALLANGGRLAMTLRHGPVPPGRRMFDISADEIIAAAQPYGLDLLYRGTRGDMLSRGGVHWDVLMPERQRLP